MKQDEEMDKENHYLNETDIPKAIEKAEGNNLEKETPMDEEVKLYKFRYLAALFLVGFINNLGYVLVGSSAQNLADRFEEGNFMGFFQL